MTLFVAVRFYKKKKKIHCNKLPQQRFPLQYITLMTLFIALRYDNNNFYCNKVL